MSFGLHRMELLGCPSCSMSLLGQSDADVQAEFPILNHTLVPFLGPTQYLRTVKTMAQALAYAAGGFHVSVARGLAGGCKDRSDGFMAAMGLFDGASLGSCTVPLNRPEIRQLWANAAQLYLEAFNIGKTTNSLTKTKEALTKAQSMAVSPYQLEGVAPPRDPGPGASPLPEPDVPVYTPPVARRASLGGGAVVAAGAGLIALTGVIVAVAQHVGRGR